MKKVFTTLSFSLLFSFCYSQNEGNTWYFGSTAGIDFNSGIAVALTNSAMYEFEGCSSISDPLTGAILFYTNGESVWNAAHQIMPNGSGLTGNSSSAQAATIVPDPGNANQYYIFTAGEFFSGGSDGYRYSIVDLSLNGGLGDVTAIKNVLLYSPACEKLAVVKNAAGNGYWIATHQFATNNFVVYPLTVTGLGAPVISAVGTTYASYNPIGYMEFSSGGAKLATVLSGLNEAEVFDFDTATGIFSNSFILGTIAQTNPYVYGIGFSPDGNRLYVTEENDHNIYQYDLTAGSVAAINASKVAVGTTASYAMQTIELAPDGKLYICRNGSSYLAVINDPNLLGTLCNFVDDGFYLAGMSCTYGLPSFPENFSNQNQQLLPQSNFSSSDSLLCGMNCIDFFDLSSNNPSSWQWVFPGATPDTSSLQNPVSICYNSSGIFDVTLITTNSVGSDTLLLPGFITVDSLSVPIITQSGDTLFCSSASSYQWYLDSVLISGATNNFYIPTANGNYSVSVPNNAGCDGSAVIQYYLIPHAQIAPLVTKVCPEDCIAFGNQSVNGSSYEWFFEGGNPNYSTDQFPSTICYDTSGYYDVTLIVHNGPYSDTMIMNSLIEVYPSPYPIIILSNDTLYCTNLTGTNTYQWLLNGNSISGATDNFYVATANGTYIVQVANFDECIGSDTMQVSDIVNGIEEFANESITVFPNPADESVTVSFVNQSVETELKIYNTLGQILFSETSNRKSSAGHREEIINLKSLPAGVYYLSLQSEKNSFTKKLVVTHR